MDRAHRRARPARRASSLEASPVARRTRRPQGCGARQRSDPCRQPSGQRVAAARERERSARAERISIARALEALCARARSGTRWSSFERSLQGVQEGVRPEPSPREVCKRLHVLGEETNQKPQERSEQRSMTDLSHALCRSDHASPCFRDCIARLGLRTWKRDSIVSAEFRRADLEHA